MEWDADVATVTVRGALDHETGVQIRDLLSAGSAAVPAASPSRLVLDLTGVTDQLGAESLALIAVIRYQLPAGCALEVRSPTRAVHDIMELAATARDAAGNKDAGAGWDEIPEADPPGEVAV